MKPDLTKAKEAAERSRDRSNYVRNGVTYLTSSRPTAQIGDLEKSRDTFLAILSSPADYLDELLEEPCWVGIAGATYDLMWCSVIGTYHVFQYPRANKAGWHFVDDEGQPSTPCDSLEAGKLAAWEDCKARMKAAFRKAPNDQR